LRRSVFAITVVVVSLFASQCLAADDQKPSDQSTAGRPVIAPDAHLKAVSNATLNRLMKYDASGNPSDSLVSESGGDVFLLQPSGRLFFYPNVNGSYINGTSTSMMLHGYGGTITLTNADTIVNGFGTGAWSSALTVNGAGTSSATAGLNVNDYAGTSLLYVRNDGNVGIGTAAPAARLHVTGLIRTDSRLESRLGGSDTAGSGASIFLGDSVGDWAGLQLSSTKDLNFWTQDNTWNVPKMTLKPAGKFGIGTTDPQTLLHVRSDLNGAEGVRITNVNAGTLGYASLQFGINGNDVAGAVFQNSTNNAGYGGPGSVNIGTVGSYPVSIITGNSSKVFVLPNGSVGIGTSTPGSGMTSVQEAPLHLYSAQDKNTFLLVQNSANSLNATAIVRTQADTANLNFASHATSRTVSRYGLTLGGWNEVLSWAGNGLVIGTSNTAPMVLGTNSVDRIHINSNGNVGINTNNPLYTLEVNGTIKATQVIGATYQDVAEWVPATTHMEPGTVVVLNRAHKNEVMPSARAYDTAVAGVVSAQPGLILGEASDSKAQIATTGRVKVHVIANSGPIGIGDLLVTSDKSGMAMKSEPLDLGGVAIHRPGTVIGKALEPLQSGEGDILVLLSLQ
jgi:hypothetical protein